MIDLDTQWREYIFRIDSLNKDKNRFQKEVTKAKKAGGEDPENAANIKEVVKEIKSVEIKLGECRVLHTYMLSYRSTAFALLHFI